jgi:CRISPR/Cas system endoribonuclease Cas6 (RAMP superfamily)
MDRDSKFKRVEIIAIMNDLHIRSKSKTLINSSDQIDLIKKIVQNLIESLLADSKLDIRRIGVKISQITTEKEKQKQLSSYF